MKTIFDKIDTKYLDCTAGTCEHVAHNFNGALLIILAITIVSVKIYQHLHTR